MFKKLQLLLFTFAIFSTMNNSSANSNEDIEFDFGFILGTFSQTCTLAVDKIISTRDARKEMEFIFEYAADTLDKDYYQSFTEFAYEEKDCIKFLP